ncbi:MAG: hypothetical protein HY606_01420 [Planctomycetes bacterium]|nr:hypothetical protein [Planctomycetota bacterium]
MLKYRFCSIKGNAVKARMLERVYDGLDGGIKNTPWNTNENLWQHYSPGKRMFECGPSWSLKWDVRTDSPGFFVGFTGWLPFLEPLLRAAYRNTLMNICKKQREDGCFPIYPQHGEYKTEEGVIVEWGMKKYNIDDYVDGHMCAIINTCEDILFTRDRRFARERLQSLRKAMRMMTMRKFKNGLMKVGYGGAFIELWYSYEGFPSSSQLFYIRSLILMSEVEKFLGNVHESEEWISYSKDTWKALLKYLITQEGYFIGAIDVDGHKHGDGTDYFESIPNVIAAPLEVIGEEGAYSICRKIATIPQLDCDVPIAVNYPARWEEFNPIVAKRGPGSHWNGGAWMGFGGFEVWTHLIAGDFNKAERLINQLLDYRDRYGLQDFVGGFGVYKGVNIFNRKPCDHPLHFQHGSAGNTLRGLFGIQPRYDGIVLMPSIFPDIKSIQFKKPIYYGDREIYVSISNGTRIKRATLNGNSIKDFDEKKVVLKYENLPKKRCFVEIKY